MNPLLFHSPTKILIRSQAVIFSFILGNRPIQLVDQPKDEMLFLGSPIGILRQISQLNLGIIKLLNLPRHHLHRGFLGRFRFLVLRLPGQVLGISPRNFRTRRLLHSRHIQPLA